MTEREFMNPDTPLSAKMAWVRQRHGVLAAAFYTAQQAWARRKLWYIKLRIRTWQQFWFARNTLKGQPPRSRAEMREWIDGSIREQGRRFDVSKKAKGKSCTQINTAHPA